MKVEPTGFVNEINISYKAGSQRLHKFWQTYRMEFLLIEMMSTTEEAYFIDEDLELRFDM